jgi:hypothetical protein
VINYFFSGADSGHVKEHFCHIWKKCCKFVIVNQIMLSCSESVEGSANASPIQVSPFSGFTFSPPTGKQYEVMNYPASSEAQEVQIHEPCALSLHTSKAWRLPTR